MKKEENANIGSEKPIEGWYGFKYETNKYGVPMLRLMIPGKEGLVTLIGQTVHAKMDLVRYWFHSFMNR